MHLSAKQGSKLIERKEKNLSKICPVLMAIYKILKVQQRSEKQMTARVFEAFAKCVCK